MKTTESTSQPAFDNARMLGEGSFTTPQGNVVHTYYIDLAGKQLPEGLCLVKVSEPQFDLRTADSVRLSRPSVFRKTGEVLVKDEQEGRARTVDHRNDRRSGKSDGSKGQTGARNQRGLAAVPREPVCEWFDEEYEYRHVVGMVRA